ncbi:MAG: rhamnose transport system ATP-binding protein [Kribbellaceae bacterium]|jgi:rhamnose transport system ATP-binding protein|nr:rhamnose transport system ATP-binding protein [Kribbellaceae bacterium]
MRGETPLLRVHEVSKSFGAVAAVQNVSFDLHGGEMHALVGENGACKSTMVKMLAGVHLPDAGTIELDGTPVDLYTPADAKAAGLNGNDDDHKSFTGAQGLLRSGCSRPNSASTASA